MPPTGTRRFDYHFMGEQVYEQPFTVVLCEPEEVPPANETRRSPGPPPGWLPDRL